MKRWMWIIAVLVMAGGTGYRWGYGSVELPNSLAALLDEPLRLDARLKTADCVMSRSLPDHECTPGGVFPGAAKDEICVPGYTKTARSVSQAMRKRVYRAYGITYPQDKGSYETDHFIPLALGGNNDIANLFPESADPKPGFREKDMVEVYLYEEVCAGRVSLTAAQRAIAANWISVYESISPATLRYLKQKYQSWDN